MSIRDPEARRAYQRKWIAERRREWFQENGPCTICGSWDQLEVDHINSHDKEFNIANLWSFARDNPKRIRELAKCRVLCHSCHVLKTVTAFEMPSGDLHRNAKLTADRVRKIRALNAQGMTYAALARLFDIDARNVSGICRRKYWRHVS